MLRERPARAAKKRGEKLPKYEAQIREFLDDETFDLNYHIDGDSPLSKAATSRKNDDNILTDLLGSHRIDVDLRDNKGRTALSHAAGFQSASRVETLLENGASPDSQDSSDRSPLSWASTSRRSLGDFKKVAKQLMKKGADINSENKKKATPLTLATISGLEEVVRDLLALGGVDVNHQDLEGRSPLSYAAQHCHLEIARYLITSGADINLSDKQGFTPLIWAAMGRPENIVHEFLSNNTVHEFLSNSTLNMDHQDHTGRTALSYFAELGYFDIVDELLSISTLDLNHQDYS